MVQMVEILFGSGILFLNKHERKVKNILIQSRIVKEREGPL